MKAINSYPKVWQLGHAALSDANILDGTVLVQEKIDGSQFSFMMNDEGKVFCRSKNVMIDPDNPGMFAAAVETVRELARGNTLVPGAIYRCEYLQKPKHNTLAYDRVPKKHLVLYDIENGPSAFASYDTVLNVAAAGLGIDCVETYYMGPGGEVTKKRIDEWLKEPPLLGGPYIEGIVIKNYGKILENGKIAMAKVVREDFKESHRDDWKQRNPNRKDIVKRLIAQYGTEMRWEKAVQHVRERGQLEGSPRDIGPLMKEASQDLRAECKEEISEALFNHFWKQIQRGAVKGLPAWYKQKLLDDVLGSDNV